MKECIRHEILHIRDTRPAAAGVAGEGQGPQGRAIRAGQHAGIVLASLLRVGCLCVVISIEPYRMPGGGWWWLAACAACAYATYFAATYSPPTPTIPALSRPPSHCWCCYRSLLPSPCPDQPTLPAPPMPTLRYPAATDLVVLLRSYLQPPHLPLLLSTRLRAAVGAATDPYYHPLVLPRHQPTLPAPPMPTLRCPAATDLVVLLRSYLQPPHPLFLHSTRLRVAMGCAAPSLPPPTTPTPSPAHPAVASCAYAVLPCSPQ